MTISFSIVLAAALAAAAFLLAGVSTWRAARVSRALEPGPFWYWAWAALLATATLSELAAPDSPVALLAFLFSSLFPALQLAGAVAYAGLRVPLLAIVLVGLAVGTLRAAAVAGGWPELGEGLALAAEPAAMLAAAALVQRTATREHAHWPHRVMPFALVAVACVEAAGSVSGAFYDEGAILWPFWLAAAIPLATLQVIARMDTEDRSRREAARANVGRELADQRFRWLAENTYDVVAELSGDGRFTWVSESSRRWLGLGPESLVGRSAAAIVRELEVEPLTSWPGNAANSQEVRASLRDGRGELHWMDIRIIPGPEGASTGVANGRFVVVGHDATDQVRAEQAIRASEERFRKFSLLGSDYCFIADGEIGGSVNNWLTGRLEEISGYDHDELQERGFGGFLHPEDMDAGRERVQRLLREGGESNHELRLITKTGETRWISERLLIEREGRQFRIYGAARDVTEQRQLEQALGRAQKLESLGLLAGGVAHDFNNLLTAMLGNAELALECVGPGSEARPHLESAVEAVEQAALLTQQLLAYTGRRGVTRIPVDLSERVRSVSRLLTTGRGHTVDLELDLAPLRAVVADPGELQQLVMNLVLNAIEACDGEGQVVVTTRLAGQLDSAAQGWTLGRADPELDYVTLEVADTGAGMSADTLERIFDPFFTTKASGRGLGLAAATGILRSVGGGLQVESKPGEGTTLTVYLPSTERPAEAPPADELRSPARARVLVVDDDAGARLVAAAMLESRGYEVETASDGRAALEAFERGEFDAVMLDAVMPGMSGVETFDALRALRPDAVILMASGYDRESAVGDLLERGLAGFIPKPFHTDELASRIAAALERTRTLLDS